MGDVQATSTVLLCARCSNYLTVFPIMTVNDELICGRCYRPAELASATRAHRNYEIECLSVMHVFPCEYHTNGCPEKKQRFQRLLHEKNCLYRPFKCFVRDCKWEGIVANLQHHVERAHPNLFTRAGLIRINTEIDYDTSTLFLKKHILYILQAKFVKSLGKFWLNVVHIRTSQYVEVNTMVLEFRSSRSNIHFEIKFSEELKPICTDTALEIDVLYLKSFLGKDSLGCSLVLRMKNGIGLMNVDLLDDLRCLVCRVFMLPPIFLCANGHSICSNCSELVMSCPICLAPLGNMHNHVLEDIVKLMYYPCKYHLNSCRFIAPSMEIRKHEEDCAYT